MDITSWTPDETPLSVRLNGSHRIHAATLVAGHLLFPACGVSVGTTTKRIPCDDSPTCPDCRRQVAA